MANINGTSGADTLRGTTLADVIWARGGNDIVSGLAGNDRLYGEAGNDSIYGGDGNDRMGGGFGNDRLFGDGGNDTLFGDAGRDYLWGGAGHDDLAGGADSDALRGNSGNDILRGDGGNDLLEGGSGNDLFYGGTGADTFIGGDGIDTVSYAGEARGVFVDLASSYAPGSWPDLEEVLTYESLDGVERVRGTAHDDSLHGVVLSSEEELNTPAALFGLGGNDTISGGFSKDKLEGDDGNDFIDGKIGNDRVSGGAGVDFLDGGFGKGDDRLTGGSGSDTFRYLIYRHGGEPDAPLNFNPNNTGADTITDFRPGEDKLVWSAHAEDDLGSGNGVFYLQSALFDVLDTNSDGEISGLDQFADSRVVEGVRSLVIDFSALLNAKLPPGEDLKGTLSGDRLILLGLNSLDAQDLAAG